MTRAIELMRDPHRGRAPALEEPRTRASLLALPAVALGAVLLRLIAGVGFANYDTLYALAWGGQLSRGQLPAYDVAVAPTPHPLAELFGLVLAPLGAGTAEDVIVAIGFLALAACAWLTYELGARWFGRLAGALAALVLLTRVPVLSYGVRAYVDIPFLALMLAALLLEARRPRAGTPALVLLALAGLLRPEAWAFSAAYVLYVLRAIPPGARRAALLRMAAVAVSAPLLWVLSDLAVTGDALWSLTNTRHTAHTLGRVTGIANVPQYIPRRVGEILRPPVLVGAALGGMLSLVWLRVRALPAALAGALAVVVFAVLASAGLSINTRYAFPASAMLCVFCGAGAFGWMRLARGHPARRWWMGGAAALLVWLAAATPGQLSHAERELDKLSSQQRIQNDAVALVRGHTLTLRCGPVGVPNHAPVPLLALYLSTSPRRIVNAQVGAISSGQYMDPAGRQVEADFALDPHDPHVTVSVPPGFSEVGANRSWRVYQHC